MFTKKELNKRIINDFGHDKELKDWLLHLLDNNHNSGKDDYRYDYYIEHKKKIDNLVGYGARPDREKFITDTVNYDTVFKMMCDICWY